MDNPTTYLIMGAIYWLGYYLRDLRRIHRRVSALDPRVSIWRTLWAVGASRRLLMSTCRSATASMAGLIGVTIVSSEYGSPSDRS